MTETEGAGEQVAEKMGETGVSDATCAEVRCGLRRKRRPRKQGLGRPGCASIPEKPPEWWLRKHRKHLASVRGPGSHHKKAGNSTG